MPFTVTKTVTKKVTKKVTKGPTVLVCKAMLQPCPRACQHQTKDVALRVVARHLRRAIRGYLPVHSIMSKHVNAPEFTR